MWAMEMELLRTCWTSNRWRKRAVREETSDNIVTCDHLRASFPAQNVREEMEVSEGSGLQSLQHGAGLLYYLYCPESNGQMFPQHLL